MKIFSLAKTSVLFITDFCSQVIILCCYFALDKFVHERGASTCLLIVHTDGCFDVPCIGFLYLIDLILDSQIRIIKFR